MVSSDFEILQSFIVESSKQRVLISIQNALQICLLGNLVIIRYFQQASENSPQRFYFKIYCNENLLKNSKKLSSPSLLKVQGRSNEILESSIY